MAHSLQKEYSTIENDVNAVITIDDDEDEFSTENLAIASSAVQNETVTENIDRIHDSIVNILIKIQNTPLPDEEIVSMFGLLYNSVYTEKIEHFQQTVAISLFKKIFYRWPGWKMIRNDRTDISAEATDFRTHLTEHLKYICDNLGNQITSVMHKDLIDHAKMTIYCSPKMLKVFFNNEPFKCENYYNTALPPSFLRERLDPKSIINWPFVTIKILLPGFEMIHKNKHTNKFKIVNLKKFAGLRCLSARSTTLTHKPLSDLVVMLPTDVLLNFVRRIIYHILNDSTLDEQRMERLLVVLNEIENDILLCGDRMLINTEYNKNAFEYPYLRYLGCPLHQNFPYKTIHDQSTIKDDTGLNIRLLQINSPSSSFILKNFDISNATEDSHVYYRNFLKNSSFVYECSVCANISFDSIASQYEIIQHLEKFHGIEPDWICPICDMTFSTKHLSHSRWYHICE